MTNARGIYSRGLAWVLLGALGAAPVLAQETGNQAAGLPMNGSFQGSDIDHVQLNNGNLHIEIPLYTLSGRGLGVAVRYVYDSKGWYDQTASAIQGTPVYVMPPNIFGGGSLPPYHNMAWTVASPLSNGLGFGTKFSVPNCTLSNGTNVFGKTSTFTYKEPNGTAHSFPPFFLTSQNQCGIVSPTSVVAKDGSGYTIFLDANQNATAVVAQDGTRTYGTVDANGFLNSVIMEDRNGNRLTRAVSSGVGSSALVDTLGRSLNTTPTLNTATGKYELKYYDSTGTQQTIQITMTDVIVHTNLCAAQNTASDGPCNEWKGAWQSPSLIQLPNGMQYAITYVQNSDGQVASLQLPTGATISYTYGSTAFHDLDDAGPKVTSRTIASDGQSQTWSYSYTPTTVHDPDGNDTVHLFANLGGTGDPEQRDWEVETDYYSGAAANGVRLKTVKTAYQNLYTQGPILPTSITTTWDGQGGLTSRLEKDYYNFNQPYVAWEGWGNVTEERECVFITGTFVDGSKCGSALARKTDYQYAHIAGNTGYNVNYLNLGIADLVTQKTVYDGSANKLTDAKITYDGAAPTSTQSTPAPNHDYTVGNYRGNATQSSVWLNTTNTWLATNNAYSDLGHVLTTTDPGGHTVTFSYADSWSGAACGVGTNTQAFLTQTTAPDTVNSQGATVHHRSQASYFACTGQKQSSRDENDILAGRTGTTYSYTDPVKGPDPLLRLITVLRKDTSGTITSETDHNYVDTPGSISVTTTEKIDNAGKNIVTTSFHDSLGRVKQTQLVSDPEGIDKTDITYDLMGRVQCVSNPYRNVSEVTYGLTCYQYDALGRKILEIPPDGTAGSNNVRTLYGGSASGTLALTTEVIDQAGHARKSYADALGHLVRVDEPNVATASSPGTKSTGSVAAGGTLQSTTSPGTPGIGTVVITGTEQSQTTTVCNKTGCNDVTTYDSGGVAVTVNGHADGAGFTGSSTNIPTPATIAADVATAINADSAAFVTAVAVNGTVYLTAKTPGTATNYTVSASATSNLNLNSFQAYAFGSLTGGTNGGPVTDSGAVELTMGSFTVSAPYGSGGNTTASAVASALASVMNSSFDSPATATVSGATLSLTSRASGSAANFPVTAASVSYHSQNFASPSFSSTSATMAGGTDGSGGDPQGLNTPAVTLYSYDMLGNLTCAVQKGTDTTAFTTCASASTTWRPRSFAYDSLSRLLCSSNPESATAACPATGPFPAGTITWTYDNDSNVLTKKDARSNTITYNYDPLHRVATVGTTHAKTYSNGDHAVDYFYDQTSYNGLTIAEGVGHETGMSDMTGSSASTFDSEGRVLKENQTINISGLTTSAVTKQLSYTYNLDGSNASVTYPDGKVINYLYNAAGHALSAIDSSGPVSYVTSATYAPHGDVSGYFNGVTSSFTGIQTTNSWNNRFQPQTFTAATLGTGAHNVMSFSFNFNQGTTGAPIDNGLLVKINNNVNTGRNTNYSYDLLNRITAGWHDATDWGAQYSLDMWGNMSQKAPCNNTMGCPTRTSGEAFSAGMNVSNRLNTYSYDASGNMLNDQLGHAFSYDAENRPYSAGGVTYYYDGAGERAAKSTGKLYWFGTGSAPVAESDAAGNLANEYIFFDGHRVAMKRMSDSTVHYYFADQIGSANVVTNATGTMPPEQDIEYHPYGEQQVYTDTLGQEYRFTGKEHDTETNNDYFGARYYSSTMGRFLTPDWSATPVPIPYASLGNPQTLNLYSYVENNPITGTDPDGHANAPLTPGCGGKAAACDDPTDDRTEAEKEAARKKKQQEEAQAKRLAQLKELKERAAQNLMAIATSAERGGRLAIDEFRIIEQGAEKVAPEFAEGAAETAIGVTAFVFTAGVGHTQTEEEEQALLHPKGDGAKKDTPEPAAAAAGGAGKGTGKGGLPPDATKLKGNQGYRDKDGNTWKKDTLHKDHWDVTDRKGNKIKEVTFEGKQLWPNGPKNKNK